MSALGQEQTSHGGLIGDQEKTQVRPEV
jgi:hypothetical protein